MSDNSMSESEKKKEDWMNSKWRPMMGWSYMVTCITDFVIFPILWSIIQVIGGGEVKMQWQPITLMGAGLYHVAMGAVLGLAAWGRTQEKLQGTNNGGITLPPTPGNTLPMSAPASNPFGATRAEPNLGNLPPVTASTSQSFGAPVATGFGGKSAPIQPPQPIL